MEHAREPLDDPDEELVDRLRRGDERAFDALVERHRRDVYRLARRMCGSHEDAHDLSQEAFVRVYRGLDRFRGDASFRTWLYRIVVNLALNHIKRSRHDGWRVPVEDVVLPVEPRGLGPLLEAERSRLLRDAIARLPDRQRETLVLKVFHDLKYVEIAAVMRCSVGTAKANFFHAVRALRRRLAGSAR